MAEYEDMIHENEEVVRVKMKEQEATLAPAIIHSPEGGEGAEGGFGRAIKPNEGAGGGGDPGDDGDGGGDLAAAERKDGDGDGDGGGGGKGEGGMASKKEIPATGFSAATKLATDASGSMDWGLGMLGFTSPAKSSSGSSGSGGGEGGGSSSQE